MELFPLVLSKSLSLFYFFRILDRQHQPFIVAIQIPSMTDKNGLTRLLYIVPIKYMEMFKVYTVYPVIYKPKMVFKNTNTWKLISYEKNDLTQRKKKEYRGISPSIPAVWSLESIPKVNQFCTKSISKNNYNQLILK